MTVAILRKYTIREMIIPFILTLLLFTFIFLTGSIVKIADTVLNKGVGFWDVMKMLGLILPNVFSFTLPTSALAAVLLTLGGFSQNNELRAMKAVGINLFTIMVPVLMIAVLLSIFALAFNDQVVTAASFAERKLTKQIIFKNPTAIFEPNRFVKDFKEYIFHVKAVKGNRLEQVIIYHPQEGKPTQNIIAEYGEIIISPDGSEITLKLYNGTVDEPGGEELYKLDFQTYTLPPLKIESAARVQKKTRELRLNELLQRIHSYDTESAKERLRYRTEFHKKISFSLAPFVFVLIGLPLAVLVRRGELIWSFSISMCVVIIYYVMYVWVGTISDHGTLPPEIALWLPNVILIGLGAFVMRRAIIS